MASVGGSGGLPKSDAEGNRGPGGGGAKPATDALARHPFARTAVALAGRTLTLWTLPDPDVLLDALTQEEFDRTDGRMPYWAVLWPSALALADAVLRGPSLGGRRVLDLGCGLGLVGLAALAKGGRVTFLDWEPVAVEVALASARDAGHADAAGVVCDWRAPPPLGPFDLVLGADVLYEARNGPAVARFLAHHLAPGGEAWITDPDRLHAREFGADLAAAGLVLAAKEPLPPRDDAKSLSLWRVTRPAG